MLSFKETRTELEERHAGDRKLLSALLETQTADLFFMSDADAALMLGIWVQAQQLELRFFEEAWQDRNEK